MSDQIPQEVMVDILRRLRIKDLVSYRRVSKQWLAIIDDPDFIRSRVRHSLSVNSNSTLFLQDRKSPTLFYRKQKYAGDTSCCYSNLIRWDSKPVRLMGSCHGLVCYCLSNFRHAFVVVNPLTGERYTPSNPSNQGRLGDSLVAYGFGHDELSDDYKVVRILDTRTNDPRYNRSYIAEIYGIRSNGFYRTIPLPTADWRGTYFTRCIGVFFGRSLHWYTWHPGSDNVIHAIDLASNTYRQLHLPQTTLRQDVIVGVVDRRLCVCGTVRDDWKIGIWVMEERVSKQLLSIIDDPHFIRTQREFAHSTNSNCALFIQDGAGTCYLRVAMKKHKYDDINSFFSTQLANYELATKSRLIGSCHGLVCFSSNQPGSLDFLVINPSTGERHTLANPSKDARRTTHDELIAHGFGYDKLSDDYKVVRILQTWSDDRHIEQSAFSAEIYGVRSKGFLRTIPLRDSDWIGFLINSMGVFSNSSLHWCTWNSYIEEYVIHAIDIVSNTYRRLHLSDPTFGQLQYLNLGIVDRRLCFCDFGRDDKISIWVMEEYWNPESWNKIYCFQNEFLPDYWITPLGSDGDKIFLLLNGRTFFWGDQAKKNVDGTTINLSGAG
ncbi:Putative F-box protein At3g16210 [Linum grandiflorum]